MAPGDRERMRVLVVSYYFPPSGGPGVQRVLKFVKYLRDFGVEPTVLTVEDGAYPNLNPALADDIPEGVAVHRTEAFSPFGAYAKLTGKSKKEAVKVGTIGQEEGLAERLARWLRANVFLPDARVGWVPYAIRAARRLHAEHPFGAIVTSGPPHSAHLVGRALKRRTGVAWVADFRDPWTGINYYDELPMTDLARRLDRRLEASVLREADRVVTVSPSWAELLEQQSRENGHARRVDVIHNGFDPEDFADVRRAESPDRDAFWLTYVGSMYAARNPTTLWAALSALRSAGEVERLRVRLVGSIGDDVRAAMVSTGLDAITEIVPYVPHDEAIRLMARAALLLLVVDPCPNENGILTGKLYEYLASGRPVLALGPPGGDADGLLQETGGGDLIEHSDVERIAECVRTAYTAWEHAQPAPGASAEAIVPYSRREETRRLAMVLEETTARVS